MEVQGGRLRADGGSILQLDTVRALHQTVVSLRAALEASKTELNNLRQKYETHLDSSIYSEAIEKLTLENHILRRKIIDDDINQFNSVELPEQVAEYTDAELEINSNSIIPIKLNVILPKESIESEKYKEKENDKSSDSEDKRVPRKKQIKFKDKLHTSNEIECSSIQAEEITQTSHINNKLEDHKDNGISEAGCQKTINPQPEHEVEAIGISVKSYLNQPESFNNQYESSVGNIQKENTSAESKVEEFQTTIELESKFDFTIKVTAAGANGTLRPIYVESVDRNKIKITKDFSDEKHKFHNLNSTERNKKINLTALDNLRVFEENNFAISNNTSESLTMAGSREDDGVNKTNDKFNVQVKITSEENLVIEPNSERESNSDHLNVEQDELSVRSISEGDNSVFSETVAGAPGAVSCTRRVCEQDSISGNDSEEVDDIELIFTTDDTKELTGFQEDLVSITEGENWVPGQSDISTPILLKFNILDPEGQNRNSIQNIETTDNFENENQENTNLQGVIADNLSSQRCGSLLETEIPENEVVKEAQDSGNNHSSRRGVLRSSGSRNYLEASDTKQQNRKSFESNDSFSFDNHKSFSFDNTKSSSFERGSSFDVGTRELSFDQRDESLDQFDVLRTTLRTQYSVYVETDISKCGVMEDDGFSGNLNVRRNTCPNPFQYRPLPHREVVRGSAARPMLAPPPARGPRRSSAAQTDISALPNHWRSDTHLAKKTLPLALTTLPGKGYTASGAVSRLAPPTPTRPARRSEEARRVLLSDIGFTSMVPELSRSAEPVWGALGAAAPPVSGGALPPLCCAAHAAPGCGSVPTSPTRQDNSNNNSRYWSRGSIQRSISGRMGETAPFGSHRVSFIEQPMRGGWRGSMPELRGGQSLCCAGAALRSSRAGLRPGAGAGARTATAGDSAGSTEELLDEADRFLRSSVDCLVGSRTQQDEFCPSQDSRPYLPTGPRQLRLGHLVKVIAPHGRVALGKVRYVGIAGGPSGPGAPITHVGLQLGAVSAGGGDGSFRGRRYFHCEPGRSVFVPFSKVIMAWADG